MRLGRRVGVLASLVGDEGVQCVRQLVDAVLVMFVWLLDRLGELCVCRQSALGDIDDLLYGGLEFFVAVGLLACWSWSHRRL